MNIQEFAARLKLSVSTVSKAMNGREDVSAATRERVLAAASRVGRAGCARFIALGHRRTALVHSPEFLMFSRHQRVGYEAALRAAGIEFDPALCVEEAISEEGGVAAARRLLDLPDPPTAIVCGHDLVALGVIRAIGETGRTAGTDVGVIGGDDHPIGRYISPALTTFSAETHRAGKRRVEMLGTTRWHPGERTAGGLDAGAHRSRFRWTTPRASHAGASGVGRRHAPERKRERLIVPPTRAPRPASQPVAQWAAALPVPVPGSPGLGLTGARPRAEHACQSNAGGRFA